MLTVIPTIDVEGMHGTRPFEQMILGEVDDGGEPWGVSRIADILEQHGAAGTFFVDVYEHVFWGKDRFRDLCRDLSGRGQDVQLHTHPSWRDDPHDFTWLRERKAQGGYLDQSRDFMSKLTLEEQVEVLRHGIACLTEWIGRAPVAHRAGGYALNGETLEALRAVGITLDSSMHHGHPNSRVTWTINAVEERDGLVQLPVTLLNYAFRLPVLGTVYRKPMKTDLDTCSLSELKAYVEEGRKQGLTTMNLFMHSYSLLRFDSDYRRFEPEHEDAEKLDAFLAWACERDDVRVLSCAQVAERFQASPDEFLGPDGIPDVVVNRKIVRLAAMKGLHRLRQAWRSLFAVRQPGAAPHEAAR